MSSVSLISEYSRVKTFTLKAKECMNPHRRKSWCVTRYKIKCLPLWVSLFIFKFWMAAQIEWWKVKSLYFIFKCSITDTLLCKLTFQCWCWCSIGAWDHKIISVDIYVRSWMHPCQCLPSFSAVALTPSDIFPDPRPSVVSACPPLPPWSSDPWLGLRIELGFPLPLGGNVSQTDVSSLPV